MTKKIAFILQQTCRFCISGAVKAERHLTRRHVILPASPGTSRAHVACRLPVCVTCALRRDRARACSSRRHAHTHTHTRCHRLTLQPCISCSPTAKSEALAFASLPPPRFITITRWHTPRPGTTVILSQFHLRSQHEL